MIVNGYSVDLHFRPLLLLFNYQIKPALNEGYLSVRCPIAYEVH